MATRGAAPTELKYRAKGGCLQRRLKTDRLIIDNNPEKQNQYTLIIY